MDNEEWQNAQLDEIHEGSVPADFEFELWLSSDNKNSVKIASKTPEGRKAGMRYAMAVYDKLLQRYGSKQGFAVKEYKTAEGKEVEEDLGKCVKCGAPNKRSMKGKIYCSAKCWLT